MSRGPLSLEEFRPEGAPAGAAGGRDPGLRAALEAEYRRGVADGTRASAAEHAEAQDQLRAALIETLQDGQMTRREIEAAAIRGLAAFAHALVTRIAPGLAEAGLADRVRDALARAFAARPDAAPRIRCAPDSSPALEAALEAWHGRYEIEPDPRLTPLEARINWAGGTDQIDPGAALAAIEAEIAALAPAADDDPEAQKDLSHAG